MVKYFFKNALFYRWCNYTCIWKLLNKIWLDIIIHIVIQIDFACETIKE